MGRLDREIERLDRIREMTKEMTPEEAERFVYTTCRGGGTKTPFLPSPRNTSTAHREGQE